MSDNTPPTPHGHQQPTERQPATEQAAPQYPPSEAQPAEHTHRFDQPAFAPAPGRATSRPSTGVVAGILAAALLVGGLSGLAGAAGFHVVDDLAGDDAATASSSAGSSTTTVSDTPDPTAPDGSAEQVAAEVLPSVVKITVRGPQGAGSGSGIILSPDGAILTNNHVVEAVSGGQIVVSFNDGSTAPAEVVGTDPLTDLAVIQAKDVSGLTPATIGQSGQLDVGENVVAIGSPFGLQATVTSGIVSALNRPVSVGESAGTDTTYPAIQTDAAINPGNSGGPLVNMRGEVVGINSSIRTASSSMSSEGGSIGLGFAIPIDNVLPIVDQLRNDETPTHARLGVSVTDAASNDGLLSGAGVQEVNAGSAAEQAGLERGDVITKVDDQVIDGSESLVATIRGHRPGDKVTLTYVRDGKPHTTSASLASDASSSAS
jgi:putative serine protease PepD